jgi:hypothetical protein
MVVVSYPQPGEWWLQIPALASTQPMSGEFTAEQLTQLKGQLGVWVAVLDQRLAEIDQERDRIEAVREQMGEAIEKIDVRLDEARQQRLARREEGATRSGKRATARDEGSSSRRKST